MHYKEGSGTTNLSTDDMCAVFQRNRLLADMTPALQEQVGEAASRVQLAAGEVLYADRGAPPGNVYFPESGVISVRNNYPTGAQVEVSAIGRNGAFGLFSMLNVDLPSIVAEVTIDVSGLAIPLAEFRRLCDDFPVLRSIAARFLGLLFRDVMRSAGCYRFHTHDQWVARWLLATSDLADKHTLPVTHDVIANRLGSQRHTVSATLGQMRSAGLIASRRGAISIVDRAGLRSAACACYVEL
jgi:CRP-like cAMP-binding protein